MSQHETELRHFNSSRPSERRDMGKKGGPTHQERIGYADQDFSEAERGFARKKPCGWGNSARTNESQICPSHACFVLVSQCRLILSVRKLRADHAQNSRLTSGICEIFDVFLARGALRVAGTESPRCRVGCLFLSTVSRPTGWCRRFLFRPHSLLGQDQRQTRPELVVMPALFVSY